MVNCYRSKVETQVKVNLVKKGLFSLIHVIHSPCLV